MSDKSHSHHLTRRQLVQAAGAGALAFAWHQQAAAALTAPKSGDFRAAVPNRAPLAAQPFYLLPVGSIKPSGWLKRQLEIQAAGMSGHLHDVWEDVGPKSGWLGGDGESWERGPYYLDGLVPLAWALDSAPLQATAQKFIDWTLSNPQPDGMIGPKSNKDWWPRMVMLKTLTQYHELTGDPRVIPVMSRYFEHQLQALPQRPLSDWGRFRWQDELVSVLWLYNRTGDAKLLDLARLLKSQGWDWQASFEKFPYKEKLEYRHFYLANKGKDKDQGMISHGVNNAMSLKTSPLWSVVSNSSADRAAIHQQLSMLDRYHGLPIGVFSADEHLAGRNPSQGVELCTVVEAMYSLQLGVAVTGDVALADRIERLAYNALPATLSDDMWTHQYDQQPNQIECSLKRGPWATNGPSANLFGFESYFGCCTANFHQGWPKLNSSLWMASGDGGLAAMIYAPCEVTTRVRDVDVRLRETTDYPFRDQVSITVEPERSHAFPLKLRVPGWARGAKVKVNGKSVSATPQQGFVVLERTWRKGDRVELAFDFETRTARGFNDSVSVEHGPLLFALPIGERWEKLLDRGFTADWEVFPTSAWNYALEQGTTFQRQEQPISAVPFSAKSPPVTVTAQVRQVPQWQAESNFALPPPQSPVETEGAAKSVKLIPYGAAKLRITSFPVTKA